MSGASRAAEALHSWLAETYFPGLRCRWECTDLPSR
jgi:hypothetical protein